MSAPRLEPGTVLAGKYRLDRPLSEGGMGTVYLAEHLILKAPVAVKVVDGEPSEGDVAVARFMREAQAAAALRSPHVVQIIDYGTEGKIPFIVMELLEGETLADRLQRMGRLGPAEAFKILSHIGRAVAKAHEAGIIHRDLKPDNVFLVHNEGDDIAKVLDFGVAKFDDNAITGARTRTGSLLGTPYYMSPEQAQGNKEIDCRSDLWALGVIAFECLTGKRPFSSEGLGDLVIQICIRDIPLPSSIASVPALFDEWFLHAVAREPERRFQSARLLTDALADALGIVREVASSAPDGQLAIDMAERGRVPMKGPTPMPPSATEAPEPSRPGHERAPGWTDTLPEIDRGHSTLPHSTGARSSEYRTGPLLPRHAVADTLPSAPSFAKSGLMLGLASMLLGGLVVFGMKRMGVLPAEVSAWFDTQSGSSAKKPGQKKSGKSHGAKIPASPSGLQDPKPTDVQKKAGNAGTLAKPAPGGTRQGGLPTLSHKITRANRPDEPEPEVAPTPTRTESAPPKVKPNDGAQGGPAAPDDPDPMPVVPPELAPEH